jgi:acyl-CoA dehydrogenase
MIVLSVFLFVAWTCVAVQQNLAYKNWLAGSALFGLIGLIFLKWGLVSTLAFYALLAGVFALGLQDSWKKYISQYFYKNLAHLIPKLSATEEQALKIGDAWLEKMIFQGDINWSELAKSKTQLTEEEQSFLDVETQVLCDMLDEWDIAQQKDLPKVVWDYLKEKGFFGLVISKEFGGKGFSARAHSDIVLKIASRSSVAATTTMVPNSLGPGELLYHYGTQEQKQYYLPRLAKGIDVPCFALTEPESGSDATSIQSSAVVCYQQIGNEKILGLKLSLEKRWITLAPVATLIGAAVNLIDPDGLLNGCGKEGITCILIDRETPNLEIGARHIPANQPFMNGTIRGKDIFVPMSRIIGGQSQAGNGWKMLVECLSIGRSISLPTLGAASSAVGYLTTGAFARLRRQFNTELMYFEGIQEKLASIAGLHYLVNANRLMTLAAVDSGLKPAVASAIAKYFNTELGRICINDAMDVHGGRAVVEGPRNYLVPYYQAIPISVTVEGANIMTRNLLIFGQGSMVCHPFVKQEFYAIKNQDFEGFHKSLWGHIKYSTSLFCKAIVTSWTGGLLCNAPNQYANLNPRVFLRLSQSFAWVADLALVTMGGKLKREERLSARLADAFSYLYLAMAVFADQESSYVNDELMSLQSKWAVEYCYAKTQAALIAFIREFPIRPLAWIMRLVVAPLGQTYQMPSDKLEKALALSMTGNSSYRDRIKKNIYLSGQPNQPIDRMELALQQCLALEAVYAKVPQIKRLKFHQMPKWLDEQVRNQIILPAERNALLVAEAARYDAMLVDEFLIDEKKGPVFKTVKSKVIDEIVTL